MNFWQLAREMRRRRVFRVAGIYFVGAWALLQVGDVIVEPAGLPAWSMTFLLYLVILGFPIALFLGWRYQFTEHGLVRSTRKEGLDSEPLSLSHDYTIFVALVAMISFALWGLLGGDDPLLELDKSAQTHPDAVVDEVEIVHQSIAVLPFNDNSEAGDQEYFGDGLADTLLQVLAQINGLKVAARTSSFAFKDSTIGVEAIAKKLRVAHILEGSIGTAGEQLRVNANLVEAKTGKTLWSNAFTGPRDNIFEIQDSIANQVVTNLRLAIAQSDELQLKERYRPNLDSYEQLILGRHEMGKGTVAGLQSSVEYFKRAIELDPGYALPNVYLADTYGWLEIYAFGFQDSFSAMSTKPTQDLQRPLLNRAIGLDPASGEARASLASIELDEQKAEQEFLLAIELNPNYSNAYLWYSKFLGLRQGRYEDSLAQLQKAVELDPLSDIIQFNYAKAVWATGRAEQAIALMLENVKRNPDFPYNYKRMARWKMQTGKVGEAMRWIKALRKLEPDSPSHWGEFGGECYIYMVLDDFGMGNQCYASFAQTYPNSVTGKRWLAEQQGNLLNLSSELVNDEPAGEKNFEPLLDLYRSLVIAEPGNGYRANQLGFALERAAEFEELVEVMEQAHPELFEDPPRLSGETTWPAMMTAHALQESGESQRSENLLAAIEDVISGMRLIAGPGFTNGIENVEVAALRGDTEKAITGLRNAIDQSWRFTWYWLPSNPNVDFIRDDPRFIAMYQELKRDMALQREWYENNKDKALF